MESSGAEGAPKRARVEEHEEQKQPDVVKAEPAASPESPRVEEQEQHLPLPLDEDVPKLAVSPAAASSEGARPPNDVVSVSLSGSVAQKLVPKNSSPSMVLRNGGRSATNEGGWCTARAAWPAMWGTWYFEATITKRQGNVRVGWSTIDGNLEANVGADQHSYAVRDVDGAFVHGGVRRARGGEPLGDGDVVGCYLHMPKDPSEAASIRFFKNGRPMGAEAFASVTKGAYYPAVSVFGGDLVLVTFSPPFRFEPAAPDVVPHPWKPVSMVPHTIPKRKTPLGAVASPAATPTTPAIASPAATPATPTMTSPATPLWV